MSTLNSIEGLNILREKYDDEYLGVVESVNDPLKQGRVKVLVYPMFKGIDKDTLPWARIKYSAALWVPPVGTWVWVRFSAGDIYVPVVLGTAQSMGVSS